MTLLFLRYLWFFDDCTFNDFSPFQSETISAHIRQKSTSLRYLIGVAAVPDKVTLHYIATFLVHLCRKVCSSIWTAFSDYNWTGLRPTLLNGFFSFLVIFLLFWGRAILA